MGNCKSQQYSKSGYSDHFQKPEGAFLVFSGQIGIAQAYSQHRFLVKGEIAQVMSIVRCMI
ncbi:MAG: hypothetical protein ACLVJO_00885 [[Clostridium] scindens]